MARRRLQGSADWATNAARIVLDRARSTEAFAAGLAAAKAEAKRTMDEVGRADSGEAEVAYLRSRGGWSYVIRTAFEEAVGDASVAGSFGGQFQVRFALDATDIAAIRTRAQAHRLEGVAR